MPLIDNLSSLNLGLFVLTLPFFELSLNLRIANNGHIRVQGHADK
jgi:hypothetical protein